MGSRHQLHDELKGLLGTNDVYFQPPESIKLKYPCYIYKRAPNHVLRADNLAYRKITKYELVYITRNPDDPLIDETESHFSMCKLVRPYAVDNLNHYSYELYY